MRMSSLRWTTVLLSFVVCHAALGGASPPWASYCELSKADRETVLKAYRTGLFNQSDSISFELLNLAGAYVMSSPAAGESEGILDALERRAGIDVDPAAYAILADAVSLTSRGTQRFGTLLECSEIGEQGRSYEPARENLGLAPIAGCAAEQPSRDACIAIALPTPTFPTNPSLRQRLYRMAVEDQAVRRSGDRGRIAEVAAEHLPHIREIVLTSGVPSVRQVGRSGAGDFFLLVQHATQDLGLMKIALSKIEDLVQMDEFSSVHYALLVDRTRVLSGEPQLYGTQSGRDEKGRFIYPISPLDGLSERRSSMRLKPLSDGALERMRSPVQSHSSTHGSN